MSSIEQLSGSFSSNDLASCLAVMTPSISFPGTLSFSRGTPTPMRRLLTFLLVSTIMATAQKTPASAGTSFPNADELDQMAARFAPAQMDVDLSGLSAGDKKALAKLIEAGRIVNHLFMQQFWSGDLALYQKLQLDKSALGKARLNYFWINKGPWSEIDEHKAFLPGVPAKKPAGANFYPEDMTREEFESWVKANPDQKEQAEGFFTV